MTVISQTQTFGAMMLCGAATGAVYDFLRLFARGGAAHAADLALGAIAAAGMIFTALVLETEVFRLYAFAGAGLGIALYRLTIGTIIRKMSSFVRNFVKKRKIMNKKSQEDAGKTRKSANV